MDRYLKDVRTKDWVRGVFPVIFGRPIEDWDNATAAEKSITIWNCKFLNHMRLMDGAEVC